MKPVWTYRSLLLAISCLWTVLCVGQDRPTEAIMQAPGEELWLGSYGSFRLSEKLFWAGEFHYRTESTDNVPYVGTISKIYNRHGIQYLFSKKFMATVGGVLRLNFDTQSNDPRAQFLVLEPRFYHEYIFFTPISNRFLVYHRLRFEHRWSRPNLADTEFTFRNRYRYSFVMKIPLNREEMGPGAVYASPGVELIMQSGKSVIDNPMEDLRIYPLVGYIVNPRLGCSMGAVYSISQTGSNGGVYRTRWLLRANVYISLDMRRFEAKIPEIKVRD